MITGESCPVTVADAPLAAKVLARPLAAGNRRRAAAVAADMRVDIWSDIVCPWCYIGKREIELGLAGFAHRDEVELTYHAFELDPSFPPGPGTPVMELLAAKYGMSAEQARQAEAGVTARAAAVGLDMDPDRVMGNTFDAHRLVALGREQGRQAEVLTGLYDAYFGQGRPVFELDALAAIGEAAGLEQARPVLAGDGYADDVRADERQAATLGITGVPFFVLDTRYGISGAQPAATLTAALEQAWRQRASAP
jgi:predicted DsbA family dithiol-disulfide isomerase